MSLTVKEATELLTLVRCLYEILPPEWEVQLDMVENKLKDLGYPLPNDLVQVKRGKTRSELRNKIEGTRT